MNPPRPTITLFEIDTGDTWPGIAVIGPIVANDPDNPGQTIAPSTTLVYAELALTKVGAKTPALFLTTDDGGITIGNAVTWELSVPKVSPEDFAPTEGKYEGSFKTRDDEGTVQTCYDIVQVIGKNKNRRA